MLSQRAWICVTFVAVRKSAGIWFLENKYANLDGNEVCNSWTFKSPWDQHLISQPYYINPVFMTRDRDQTKRSDLKARLVYNLSYHLTHH